MASAAANPRKAQGPFANSPPAVLPFDGDSGQPPMMMMMMMMGSGQHNIGTTSPIAVGFRPSPLRECVRSSS